MRRTQETPGCFPGGRVLNVGTTLKLVGDPLDPHLGFHPLGLFNHSTDVQSAVCTAEPKQASESDSRPFACE
jgi:hypothetical protein